MSLVHLLHIPPPPILCTTSVYAFTGPLPPLCLCLCPPFLSNPLFHSFPVPVPPGHRGQTGIPSSCDCFPASLCSVHCRGLTYAGCLCAWPDCLSNPGSLFPLCLLMDETAFASFCTMTFAWSVCSQGHASHSILAADSCSVVSLSLEPHGVLCQHLS